MSNTVKFGILGFILVALLGSKYVMYDYPISSGKRVGNLTKLALRGKIWKTWEGTINEGYGDKLSMFSVQDSDLAKELFEYEGREVIIYYEEYFYGWPNETNLNVVGWEPKDPREKGEENPLVAELGKSLFCSLLGTLYNDQALYQKVKEHVAASNPYIHQQYEKCNK
jgi:hypothetical protein